MTDEAPEWEPPGWFWDLLESSHFTLQTLAAKLEGLPRDQLRLFQENFEDAKGEVNPFYRDDSGDIAVDCHSEDGAEDFSAWVVGQGRVFYREVRTQPGLVNQFLDIFYRHDEGGPASGTYWNSDISREEYKGSQCPSYIAYAVYRERFKTDLRDDLELG